MKVGYTSAVQVWEHEWIDQDDISRRWGVNFGVFAEFFDYHNISLITGLDYFPKGMGYEVEVTDEGGFPDGTRTNYSLYHYLSVPILAKYTVERELASPYILLGPRISYFISYAEGDHFNMGIEDMWTDMVLELTMGVGVEKKLFSGRTLLIEFMYSHEPFWQYEAYNCMTEENFRVKNNTWCISAGMGF
ncbi:MAG: PorT family protein [Candidatus Krumholzibacteria bacterium]|nr:PorT family protein [Candidatus Krumholzibacteria bacterium]